MTTKVKKLSLDAFLDWFLQGQDRNALSMYIAFRNNEEHGIQLFKHDTGGSGAIVPIAFPLIAGAGSITTLLSLRAEYQTINILIALSLNMIIVYLVLRLTNFFERILGPGGLHILRKFFGIILLAIAIRLFLSNTGIEISKGM